MLGIVLALLAVVLLIMSWQHFRYLRIRRTSAQDHQQLVHWGSAFHVIVFFRVRNGDKVIDTARRFKQKLTTSGRARLVYAGQSAFSVKSVPVGDLDWHGILLFQYPSRLDFEQSFADPKTCEARELFADSYLHGMRRNSRVNMAIPQFLLRLRLKDVFSGKWQVAPLRPSPAFATFPEYETWRRRVARLRALHKFNRQGLVVFNLVRKGTRKQQAADSAYAGQMMSRMAALAHGPLHTGRPVALEGSARFDGIYVIQYPSANYYADLRSSQFFHDIAGNKMLGDSVVVPTVPITRRL